jgi:hypothetical protein
MLKRMYVFLCLSGMIALTGCPSNSIQDAIQLTVGGESVTAALTAKDIHWYKTQLKAQNSYAFILKSDEYESSVGVVFSVYLVENDVQSLMWQEHYDPAPFAQLTQEHDNIYKDAYPEDEEEYDVTKQVAVPFFMAPKSGTYHISLQAYTSINGTKPANTYAYNNTLVYSVAVKYAVSPFNPQGTKIEPEAQAANVPFINTMIESYEEVYHPVALKQNHIYQVQLRRSDIVEGPIWLNEYGEYLSDSMYFMAPYSGTYLLWVGGPGNMFGYTEYGLRVQEDDHGNNESDATAISIGNSVNGYLGEKDQDWFVITIPGKEKPSDKYRISLDNPNKFKLSGLESFTTQDEDGKLIAGQHTVLQQTLTQTIFFQIKTKEEFSYLNDLPNGSGAYKISLEKIAIPQ